jgi:hypothetical protein
LFTAYAIFVAMAVVAWRRSVPRPRGSRDDAVAPSPPRVVRGIVGGYVAFLAIVLIFHVWLADDPAAFVSAAGGGAFLCGVVMVVAAGWSLIQRRHLRQR